MENGRQYTVNSKQTLKVGRLTINRKQLTVFAISFILLVSFVTVAIATGFFGINTTKVSSLEKGLVGHWMLDAENGAKDLTPYGNHGTAQGGVTIGGAEDRKGKSGGATEFDGVDNRIDFKQNAFIPILSEIKAVSVSLFFNAKGLDVSEAKMFLGISSGGNNNIVYIGINPNGTIVLGGRSYKDDTFRSISSINPIELDKFNHVVGILDYENGKIHIYINGIYDSSGDVSWLYDHIDIISPSTARIGMTPLISAGRYFNGVINDFKIYNRALSEDEIQLLYDSYKPKASASDLNKGLVGHWMLDSENGAKDLTPYGNHGTGQGGITIGGAEDRKGKSGGATSFDGSNDYVDCGHDGSIHNPNTMSWSFWCNRNGYISAGGIFNKYVISGNKRGYTITNDNRGSSTALSVSNSKDGDTMQRLYTKNGFFEDGNWIYGTVIFDNGKWYIYKNGELFDELISNQPTIYNTDRRLEIGGYTEPSAYFKGKLADMRIYNRALSEDEIKLLFDSYKPKEASVGNLNKGLILDMPLTTKYMKSDTIVADRTPYGNDGILMNGVNITNEGAVFDGVNDYVNLGNVNSITSSFTISAWINALSFNNPLIVSKGTSSTWFNNNYVLALYPNKVRFKGTFSNSIELDSNTILSANTWYHIVGVYNQELQKANIYINGVKDTKENTNCKNPTTVAESLRIGGFSSSQLFNGTISNVRIYNRALSDEEIKLLYEKGRW